MKTAYIIPAFTEYPRNKIYQKIKHFFQNKKIKPVLINIKWKNRTMPDYVEQFMKQYRGGKVVYFFGFSFGAMVAFISAAKTKPKAMILCSLSPYFKEDLKKINNVFKNNSEWKKIIGKRRFSDFRNFSFNDLVKKINCKTFLLIGGKEHKLCLSRSKEAHKKIKNSSLIIIDGAKHNIRQKEYLAKIKEVISAL